MEKMDKKTISKRLKVTQKQIRFLTQFVENALENKDLFPEQVYQAMISSYNSQIEKLLRLEMVYKLNLIGNTKEYDLPPTIENLLYRD